VKKERKQKGHLIYTPLKYVPEVAQLRKHLQEYFRNIS